VVGSSQLTIHIEPQRKGGTINTYGSIYGLFGPQGFLGIYTSRADAMMAGDRWADSEHYYWHGAWKSDQPVAGVWQAKLSSRADTGVSVAILRVCLLVLSGKARQAC
jgi:hypothetical protein